MGGGNRRDGIGGAFGNMDNTYSNRNGGNGSNGNSGSFASSSSNATDIQHNGMGPSNGQNLDDLAYW